MTNVHLGFLTVIECARDGFVGGLLILNQLGRPLEFHCSVPVRPNRAQEILYGPTLCGFLCGERKQRKARETRDQTSSRHFKLPLVKQAIFRA